MIDKPVVYAAVLVLLSPARAPIQLPQPDRIPARATARKILVQLQSAIARDDRREVASLVAFPLTIIKGRILGSTYVGSVKVFMTTYQTAFSKRVREAVMAQNPDSLVLRNGMFVVGAGDLAIGVRCATDDVRSCQTGVVEVRPYKPEP